MSREERSRAVWSAEQRVPASQAGCASLGTGMEVEAHYRHREEWRRFRELVPLQRHWRVAEIGTGNGRWLESFSPVVRECIGVDYSESMLAIARDRIEKNGMTNCRLIHASATEDALEGRFELIYFSGCLQYLDDDEVVEAIRVAVSHLQPDGWLVDRTTVSLTKTIEGNADSRFSIYRTAEQHVSLFARQGFVLEARRQSYVPLWVPAVLRVRPLRNWTDRALRATARWWFAAAARVSAVAAKLRTDPDQRDYSHDFFVFRRSNHAQ